MNRCVVLDAGALGALGGRTTRRSLEVLAARPPGRAVTVVGLV